MSSYRFIFALLLSKSDSVPKINNSKDYNFTPLGCNKIYTIDGDVWKNFDKGSFVIYYPNRQEFNLLLENDKNFKILIALSDKKTVSVPGRGETVLTEFTRNSKEEIEAGYDVTDIFGLSAIANIGYSKEEAKKICKLNLAVTEYGLLKSKEDAKIFTEFANKHIIEHEPFMPLKILIKKSN